MTSRKVLAGFTALAVAVSLCPAFGPASEEAYADDGASRLASVSLQTQSLGIFETPVKLVEALPSASKAKAANYKAWQKAYDALDDAWDKDEISNASGSMSETELARVRACSDKLTEVGNAIKKDATKQAASVKKTKVKGVKATPVKGNVKVTWKALGKKYKYDVYYSAKKNSGYKLAGSTSGKKLTVKKLESGKTYYFKVRGYRTNLPVSMSVDYGTWIGDEVYTKYSAVVSATV